ncbi:MAG: anhydro-N-acetylmuramic acid kinase [Rhodospirillaceae bacterium]|nr:anhydro-N-acetylmuramic acid kinase [Rhodospirillaceae bacterium]MCY4236790.1 anhydro-N-acetylmuramic acid kinase [Rhodospirillaceae bacterium]
MTMRTAVGLMSGTSADGVDVALIRSDGVWKIEAGAAGTYPYSAGQRDDICACFGRPAATDAAIAAVTEAHRSALAKFLAQEALDANSVDWVGFHGQTIFHDPDQATTVQIGDAQALADATGLPFVSDFRSEDMRQGGQGAPLAPLFHAALSCKNLGKCVRPRAVLNLGGVANVTWIGGQEESDAVETLPLLAFDVGPASALIDDFMSRRTGQMMDWNGQTAAKGTIQHDRVAAWMKDPYFAQAPPKSLDRNTFLADVEDLSIEDGAATLTAFTVATVKAALDWMPIAPVEWQVSGGGRRNGTMMQWMASALHVPVLPVEAFGWNGDALEAQAFAWLALRVADGRPTSIPGTTGVSSPTVGGKLHWPA